MNLFDLPKVDNRVNVSKFEQGHIDVKRLGWVNVIEGRMHY